MATLGTAAPLGPPQIAQPRGGGITVFRYPAGLETQAGAVTAYLIDGRVGFWSLSARPTWTLCARCTRSTCSE